jgi:DNA-binding transcriptional regulator YiaG
VDARTRILLRPQPYPAYQGNPYQIPDPNLYPTCLRGVSFTKKKGGCVELVQSTLKLQKEVEDERKRLADLELQKQAILSTLEEKEASLRQAAEEVAALFSAMVTGGKGGKAKNGRRKRGKPGPRPLNGPKVKKRSGAIGAKKVPGRRGRPTSDARRELLDRHPARILRDAAGASQAKFADTLGLSASGYRNFELGVTNPTEHYLRDVADRMGLSASEVERFLVDCASWYEDLKASKEAS